MTEAIFVTKDFEEAFDNLTLQKQQIVYSKIKYLSEDQSYRSLNVHGVKQAGGKVKECYIDKGMRLLFETKQDNLYLWNMGGHSIIDNIRLRRFDSYTSFNKWNVVEAVETSNHVETEKNINKTFQTSFENFTEIEGNSAHGTLNYFAYYPASRLRMLGIPEELIQPVKDAPNLETALDIPGLSEKTRSWLLDLSTSSQFEHVLFDSSQLLFRTTLDRLEGYCKGKIKKLMLNLEVDQQKYVEVQSPLLLLRGSAGSGKTTVGIYRAIHLAEQGRKVVVLAFSNTLSSVTKSLIEELIGPLPSNLEVRTLHSLMVKFLGHHLNIPSDDGEIQRYLREALNEIRSKTNSSVLRRDLEFFREEIRRVIKGLGLKTVEEYKQVKRYGRQTALGPKQRELVWEVYVAYQRGLTMAKRNDWSDPALLMLSLLDETPFVKYDDIIVDEAQDLTPIDLRLIQRLVKAANSDRNKSSIMILGDAAQTIYARGFSWEQAGLSVRGHTANLRKNHRNTYQVAVAATHLLKSNVLMRASNEYIDPEYTSRQGPLPMLLKAKNAFNQIELARDRILELVSSQDFRLSDFAILCRTNKTCLQCKQELEEAGLRAVLRDDKSFNILEDQVKVLTLHSAKGLEFPVVFIIGLTEGELPLFSYGFNTMEEEEKQLEIEKERTLCYVAITRSAEALYLLTVQGKESRFVKELGDKIVLA